MLTIYHNATCSKSLCAIDLLRQEGQQLQIVEYLKQPPTVEEMKALLKKLQMKPEDLVRKGEPVYKEQFAGRQFSDEEWLQILSKNSVLIERPIVVNGDRAVIARPPERVQEIL